MKLRRTKTLSIELYKAINNVSPEFMKYLLKFRQTNRTKKKQYNLNLEISKTNQVSFCTKRLCIQGPKVWKALPFHIISKENFQAFKKVTKFSGSSKCICNICFDSDI